MDVRTGKVYASPALATAAGVPKEDQVELVILKTGPFRGRVYERLENGGLGRRRRDVEQSQPARLELLKPTARQVGMPRGRRRPNYQVVDEVTRNPRASDLASE